MLVSPPLRAPVSPAPDLPLRGAFYFDNPTANFKAAASRWPFGDDRYLRNPAGWSRRRLRPSLGNDCRIFTASPLAPYAPKAKTASECGEVPTRGSKHFHYLIVIIYLYDQE